MKTLPRIVIVGFPNVGKSTLFNRLLKKKKSLVHSQPGMTRDQVSVPCDLEDRRFILVDTGGFFDFKEDPFSAQVKEKAWEASLAGDVLLFVLDGKRDLVPAEEELFYSLKKLDKPIFVIVNKIDSLQEEDRLGDFFRLGADSVLAVSAEHKRNLDELEARLIEVLPLPGAEKEEEEPLRIALVGRINVGKSSIVNLLSGQDTLIVSEIPGTTRDSTDTLIRRNQKNFCLVDTAGIRKLSRTRDKREKASIIKAKKDITQADVICMVMDLQEFPTRQDTAIAHLAYESGKPLILALNKWDLIDKDSQPSGEFKARMLQKMDFVSYAPVLFISAFSGKRVIKILDMAEEVYSRGKMIVSTSRLNEFLAWVNEKHPLFSKNKSRIKIKYITQKSVLPPTFLLFTHSRSSLAPTCMKHFIRLVRERFGFSGNPVRVILRRN
jgi:GTP-binding protein